MPSPLYFSLATPRRSKIQIFLVPSVAAVPPRRRACAVWPLPALSSECSVTAKLPSNNAAEISRHICNRLDPSRRLLFCVTHRCVFAFGVHLIAIAFTNHACTLKFAQSRVNFCNCTCRGFDVLFNVPCRFSRRWQ